MRQMKLAFLQQAYLERVHIQFIQQYINSGVETPYKELPKEL